MVSAVHTAIQAVFFLVKGIFSWGVAHTFPPKFLLPSVELKLPSQWGGSSLSVCCFLRWNTKKTSAKSWGILEQGAEVCGFELDKLAQGKTSPLHLPGLYMFKSSGNFLQVCWGNSFAHPCQYCWAQAFQGWRQPSETTGIDVLMAVRWPSTGSKTKQIYSSG